MKQRQRKKILKRSGAKLHKRMTLTPLERKVSSKVADSKLCSALCKFNNAEFEAGTIYEDGYLDRFKQIIKDTSTIENITGVRK
jgi:hypothetical protein